MLNNRNFGKELKCCSRMENFVKKWKFCSKVEILGKNRNFAQKFKILLKNPKFCSKIGHNISFNFYERCCNIVRKDGKWRIICKTCIELLVQDLLTAKIVNLKIVKKFHHKTG